MLILIINLNIINGKLVLNNSVLISNKIGKMFFKDLLIEIIDNKKTNKIVYPKKHSNIVKDENEIILIDTGGLEHDHGDLSQVINQQRLDLIESGKLKAEGDDPISRTVSDAVAK